LDWCPASRNETHIPNTPSKVSALGEDASCVDPQRRHVSSVNDIVGRLKSRAGAASFSKIRARYSPTMPMKISWMPPSSSGPDQRSHPGRNRQDDAASRI
jgi:hypothetical protein